MTFAWTESISTGIAEIDDQHKALIGRFNDLLAACSTCKGSREIGDFLRFLTGYVIAHFSDEERLMRERAYPGLDAHRREHDAFRERLARLRDGYIAGIRQEIVSESVWLAAEWFVGHIKSTDLAMAAHVRSHDRRK